MDAVRDHSQFTRNPGVSEGGDGVRARLKVWIDQDLCTGDGLCTDHAPSVFTLLEDGIAYVVEDGQVLHDPGGPSQLAVVSPAHEDDVIHAAAECPGECIFIELHEAPALEA
jgi:ferredoxin